MTIKNLKVRHFRGIERLDWEVAGRFVCLIGPGDSTKTTILRSVELVLTPRRNFSFDDADFYYADTDNPILIEITVGDVPTDLLSDAKFGYLIRGWGRETGVRDEPGEDDDPVITIQLRVDNTLEPTWRVVNDRDLEGKPISAFDRARFGVSRIGDYVDWQLSCDPRSLTAGARSRAIPISSGQVGRPRSGVGG